MIAPKAVGIVRAGTAEEVAAEASARVCISCSCDMAPRQYYDDPLDGLRGAASGTAATLSSRRGTSHSVCMNHTRRANAGLLQL